jgi:hypothetical protein
MKLTCYSLYDVPPRLRPAPATRDWMDETPEGFAYRCLPLNIANSHGWEVLNPYPFSAIWDGGPGRQAISLAAENPAHLPALSHFGSGVLTFHIPAVFRTEAGFNLFVTGPVNSPKDGIAPLAGVIETDWAPYTFTMNWRFTRPGALVRFEENEPFCFFFPVARDLPESIEPEIRPLASDKEVKAQYEAWTTGRQNFLKELPVQGSDAQARKWEKTYYRGLKPDGSAGTGEHRTKLHLRPFTEPS